MNPPQYILIFAIRIYRWTIAPAQIFLFGAGRRLPFHAVLLAIRDGCGSRAGGITGGWLAMRRICRCHPWGDADTIRCPSEDRRSEIGDRNLISHGPHRHHRRHALRHPARLVFLRAAKISTRICPRRKRRTNALAAAANNNGKCRRPFARASRGPGFSFDTNTPEQTIVLTNSAPVTRSLRAAAD